MENKYTLVVWPDSQDVMDNPDAIFIFDDEFAGPSAYFVPAKKAEDADYVLVEWPDSQEWLENKDCCSGEDSSVFVPLELMEKSS